MGEKNAPAETTLNPGLARLHVFFCGLYLLLLAIVVVLGLSAPDAMPALGTGIFSLFLGPFIVLHWIAVRGARRGSSTGRAVSRAIALFWFVGFPVGTALAIYVFNPTGRRAWNDVRP